MHSELLLLNNWRKHGEQRAPALAGWTVDPYASGLAFEGWRRPPADRPPPTYEPLAVVRPQSWLLALGWRRAGGPISFHAVPGPLGQPSAAPPPLD